MTLRVGGASRTVRQEIHRLLQRPYTLALHDSKGTGPTVVLLHGLGTSRANWDQVVPLLPDNYRIITLDLLGFGESPKPDNIDYVPADHVQSIHHTLKKAGVKTPFILVGHSMGAILVIHYAVMYPRSVDRLILCSLPLYHYAEITNRLTARWASRGDKTLLAAYERFRGNKDLSLKAVAILKRAMSSLIALELNDETWYSFYQSLHNTIENQNLEPLIKKINVPIDLVYGRLDALINTANLVYLVRNNPKMVPHIVRSGHDLTRSLATKVAEVIIEKRTK